MPELEKVANKNIVETNNPSARASLELLYEIGREVASYLDLHTVLHRVLFLTMKNIGATSGSIIVLDDESEPVESAFLMFGQSHDHTALQLRVTYEQGMAGWVARHQQAVLIPDTSQDERWLRLPDDDIEQTGPKSAVSAPILAGDRLVGVITVVHPYPGFFTSEHLALVEAIASQAGTAVRNAQLFKSLEAAHKRYHELFQDSIDPILITDKHGHILEANRKAEAAIGLEDKELRSLTVGDVHRLDFEKVGADFAKLTSGETVSYESVLCSHEGREIPIQVYVRSFTYEDVEHLQWILQDITERKDLDSLREDLIAMVYHDLRSPLMNIVSSLEVLSSMFSGQEDSAVGSLFNIALRSTERIQRLTNSLLDINRLEAGQTIGDRKPLDPYVLVDEALDAVTQLANGKDLEITTELPPGLPKILADADMVRRVLINLLENAVKFTPAGGKICVGAMCRDGFLQMWVQDSGPGIPQGDQERIFEKFTRLNWADGPKGLGLGLAFCRLAVVGHGGRIWVKSQVGKGSDFRFEIPVADEAGL